MILVTIKPLPKLFENEYECCGCTACYAICPVNAIKMNSDEKGFLYPFIDENKCIRCYKCIDVCSFKKDTKEETYTKYRI